MAITLTKVTRIGTPPTTQLLIEGTVDSCETLYVTSSCTNPLPGGNGYSATITGLGGPPPQKWSATLPNDLDCGCGTPVKVSASCQLGMPSGATVNFPPITILCDTCPTAAVTRISESTCDVNGKRTVTLEATVTSPANSVAVGQWDFGYAPTGGSSAGPQIGVPQNQTQSPLQNPSLRQTWDYPPGTYTACLKWNTSVHPGCTDECRTFSVSPCPPPSCEVLLSYSPNPVPCIPSGGSQKVDFEAKLNPLNPAYTGPFTWEVTKAGQSIHKVTRCAPTFPTPPITWNVVSDPDKFSYTFTSPGSYDVTVTIATPGCDDSFDTATASPQIVIKGCCPTFTGQLNAQQDPNNPCLWMFFTQVDNPNSLTLQFDWLFENRQSTGLTTQPFTTHVYPPGFVTHDEVEVTMSVPLHPECGTLILKTIITPSCPPCPTVGTPNAVVTGCVPGPGTAPGTPPAVVLITRVSPPVATSFDWTVTTPGGTSFTKTTTAARTTDGTADGAWTDTSTGSTGVLNLGASGGYAVTVKAKGPAISSTCMQPPAISFPVAICLCPPGMARDTSGVCVPIIPPTPSCSIACNLAGFFLIAIPISAGISSLAHCFFVAAAIWAVTIGIAIGVFIATCGICCLWRWLLVGVALGVVATAVASYWLGPPLCWWQGAASAGAFVGIALGMGAACKFR